MVRPPVIFEFKNNHWFWNSINFLILCSTNDALETIYFPCLFLLDPLFIMIFFVGFPTSTTSHLWCTNNHALVILHRLADDACQLVDHSSNTPFWCPAVFLVGSTRSVAINNASGFSIIFTELSARNPLRKRKMGLKHCRHLPLKTQLKILVVSAAGKAACRPDGTVNRRLASLVELTSAPNPKPVHGVRTADVTVDPTRNLWFRLFLPASPSDNGSLPVVVFFHGGGFSFLSAGTVECDAVCRRFCRKLGVAVISVNYRLAPEHRFPAQYDDGIDVLRFLDCRKTDDRLLQEFFNMADLSMCFLAGDSAGANIAHHVASRWTADVDRYVKLAGIVSIQPFFGGETRVNSEIRLRRIPVIDFKRTDWLWKAFLPRGATRDHPAANPEAAAAAAAAKLGDRFPPVMVAVGELDPLQDWQRKYFDSLRANGMEAEMAEYPGVIHAFYFFPELKQSAALIEDVGGFIRRQTRRRHAGMRVSTWQLPWSSGHAAMRENYG